MTTILLTLHILVAVALVASVLLQRNEGRLGYWRVIKWRLYDSKVSSQSADTYNSDFSSLLFNLNRSSDFSWCRSKQTSIVDEVLNSTTNCRFLHHHKCRLGNNVNYEGCDIHPPEIRMDGGIDSFCVYHWRRCLLSWQRACSCWRSASGPWL